MNKELLEYIEELESESFEGWSEDAISGYLTACKSIAEKFIAITIKDNESQVITFFIRIFVELNW